MWAQTQCLWCCQGLQGAMRTHRYLGHGKTCLERQKGLDSVSGLLLHTIFINYLYRWSVVILKVSKCLFKFVFLCYVWWIFIIFLFLPSSLSVPLSQFLPIFMCLYVCDNVFYCPCWHDIFLSTYTLFFEVKIYYWIWISLTLDCLASVPHWWHCLNIPEVGLLVDCLT